MDIFTDFLPQKVKNINSTIYSNVLLWKSTVPFSMRSFHCKKCYRYQHQVGLKTLAVVHREEKLPYNVVHCYTIAPSSKPSSTPPLPPPPPPPPPIPPPPSMWLSCSYAFRCTMIGDVLGAESGDYMTFEVKPEAKEQEEEEEEKPSSLIGIKLRRGKEEIEEEKMKKKRELPFPPPITLMRTHTGRMPWNFKRECGDYGRLVITAERVNRREYVEALRVNGKVTMKLVPEEEEEEEEEESEYCEECGYSMNEEEEEETVELEDLEFNHEEEEEEEEEEEVVEEEDGFELEVEEEGYNSNLWDKERGLCWDFSECSVGVGDSNDFMGRPGSGPAHLRPITSVM